MVLTEIYAYNYVLKPDSTHSAETDPSKTHQALAAGHKLVLAFANLSTLSEHKGVEATAGGGVSTNVGDGSPLLIDSGITEVNGSSKPTNAGLAARP